MNKKDIIFLILIVLGLTLLVGNVSAATINFQDDTFNLKDGYDGAIIVKSKYYNADGKTHPTSNKTISGKIIDIKYIDGTYDYKKYYITVKKNTTKTTKVKIPKWVKHNSKQIKSAITQKLTVEETYLYQYDVYWNYTFEGYNITTDTFNNELQSSKTVKTENIYTYKNYKEGSKLEKLLDYAYYPFPIKTVIKKNKVYRTNTKVYDYCDIYTGKVFKTEKKKTTNKVATLKTIKTTKKNYANYYAIDGRLLKTYISGGKIRQTYLGFIYKVNGKKAPYSLSGKFLRGKITLTSLRGYNAIYNNC